MKGVVPLDVQFAFPPIVDGPHMPSMHKNGHIFSWSGCHYCISVRVPKYNGICSADLSHMQAALSRLTHGPEEQEEKMLGDESGANKIYSH